MITLTVTPDNGEAYEVTATSRDVLTWEKTTKGNKSFVDLMNSPNLMDLYKVAHLASWRQGLYTGNFQSFEETCEVTAAVEADDPDPTQSDPYTESASHSPSEPASPRPSGRKKANAQS
jgi:hypothetical protein